MKETLNDKDSVKQAHHGHFWKAILSLARVIFSAVRGKGQIVTLQDAYETRRLQSSFLFRMEFARIGRRRGKERHLHQK